MDRAWKSCSRTWLVPFLLLSMQDRNLHGHELLERLGVFGLEATRPGEVYRTLKLLEREGLTFSDRENTLECLLSQRTYGLTEDGVAYLEFLAHSLEQYGREIERFFLAYEAQPAYGTSR